MLYAKIALGIPPEGPFDYSVPSGVDKNIKAGMRAWVDFRAKRMLGYVVKITRHTDIKNVKPILDLIDDFPVLDKNMLYLAKEISSYYGCSWGEAIETALPAVLRKGKKIINIEKDISDYCSGSEEVTLIHGSPRERWEAYLESIKEAQDSRKSVIFLLPDIHSLLKAESIISANLGITPVLLYRQQPKELESWIEIKKSGYNIVLGTRSAVFAPVNNLGLIIIDEEESSVYKQDQVPHYHARVVAAMRIHIEAAKLILGSHAPSLESFYSARQGKINPSTRLGIDGERPSTTLRVALSERSESNGRSRTIKYISGARRRNFPEVKIIDTSRQYNFRQKNIILSKYLQDGIAQALDEKGKILLFLNRKGFATSCYCQQCGASLTCPRCNVNLVYHFKDNTLNCHYCNFKMPSQRICPTCNSGYIRYIGTGTEKIESELSRLFPSARIQRLDKKEDIDLRKADIFISTQAIIKETDCKFDLIGVLSIDNSLNRIDFRSAEKTFGLLAGLLWLTEKKILIQTRLRSHYCLRAIENKDFNIFYEEELEQRKQLGFPPFGHLCLVKLRGKNECRVKEASNNLFNKLGSYKKKGIKVISANPGQPEKLRGKFYWQILIKGSYAQEIVKFLKLHLKTFAHSGIIVTIDMDPV